MKIEVQLTGSTGAKTRVVELIREGESYRVHLDGRPVEADVMQLSPNTISVLLGSNSFEVHVTPTLDNLKIQTGPEEFTAEIQDPRVWRGRKQGAAESEGRQQVIAPMPGKVIRMLVNVGDAVESGQGLLIVEAMKMQNEIRSPKSGRVERILAQEGQKVNAGEVLAWIE